uniref:Uncharacterized protein n=1 Tax=Phocoena sinus TaxID=42100 RepID=A0A8C9BHP3_PHOSS
ATLCQKGCSLRPSWLCNMLGLKSHIFSLPEEKHPFMCEYAGWCKRFAIKHSPTRHADMKKMKIKVKASHEKSSWAFHLSGCFFLPKYRELLNGIDLSNYSQLNNQVVVLKGLQTNKLSYFLSEAHFPLLKTLI